MQWEKCIKHRDQVSFPMRPGTLLLHIISNLFFIGSFTGQVAGCIPLVGHFPAPFPSLLCRAHSGSGRWVPAQSGRPTITTAIKDSHVSLFSTHTHFLIAFTNCTSCRPEIQNIWSNKLDPKNHGDTF